MCGVGGGVGRWWAIFGLRKHDGRCGEQRGVGHGVGVCEDVVKLADVAGPEVPLELFDGIGGEVA